VITYTRIAVDSAEHNNSFFDCYLNMLLSNVPSSGWQEWKIKYTVLNGN